MQVLCNSLPASLMLLLHAWHLRTAACEVPGSLDAIPVANCLPRRPMGWMDCLPFGVLGMYAAVAADTFSSELGILAEEMPVLITDVGGLMRRRPMRVPRGTNGGVTLWGLLMGLGGAACMAGVAALLTPFCGEEDRHRVD